MEAVMKKFQGRSVPKPSMKKISQTDLYLTGGQTDRWSDRRADRQVVRQTGGQTDRRADRHVGRQMIVML